MYLNPNFAVHECIPVLLVSVDVPVSEFRCAESRLVLLMIVDVPVSEFQGARVLPVLIGRSQMAERRHHAPAKSGTATPSPGRRKGRRLTSSTGMKADMRRK